MDEIQEGMIARTGVGRLVRLHTQIAPPMRVQTWMPALSVPTTKADFAPDLSERLSLLQERLTSDKVYMRFYRVR